MACKKNWIDESIIQPPVIHIDKSKPKGKPDPKVLADVEAKLKKHHM